MELKEAIDILKNVIADEVIGTYCIEIQKTTECSKNCETKDCYLHTAIDTVLKALEELNELGKIVEKFPVDSMSNDTKLILITKGNFLDNPCFKNLLDDYISKDKIKKKIEESRKQIAQMPCGNDCERCFDKNGNVLCRGSEFDYCDEYYKIDLLQELLKGE